MVRSCEHRRPAHAIEVGFYEAPAGRHMELQESLTGKRTQFGSWTSKTANTAGAVTKPVQAVRMRRGRFISDRGEVHIRDAQQALRLASCNSWQHSSSCGCVFRCPACSYRLVVPLRQAVVQAPSIHDRPAPAIQCSLWCPVASLQQVVVDGHGELRTLATGHIA